METSTVCWGPVDVGNYYWNRVALRMFAITLNAVDKDDFPDLKFTHLVQRHSTFQRTPVLYYSSHRQVVKNNERPQILLQLPSMSCCFYKSVQQL